MKRSSLGTGLSSLIPNKNMNVSLEKRNLSSSGEVVKIAIDLILPNPNQPRYYFDENNLNDLSESIKEHGVIQPIIVTQGMDSKYELIAGERRLQASKIAGLKEIPAVIRLATNQQKLELALVENIQRHDLNAIEEAKAYRRLQTEFNLTQEEIAKRTGKSRPTIANIIRLLELPVEIQRGVIEGKITEGHARTILSLDNPEKQRALYQLILKNDLTVRAAEDKVKEITVNTHKRRVSENKDPYIQDIEDKAQQKLGTKVKITKKGATGRIAIDFFSEEEFGKIIGFIS